MKARLFAEGTSVSVSKSRDEIESLLMRYGADGFAYAQESGRAAIMFSVLGRRVRFVMLMPTADDARFTRHPKYSWKRRTEAQAREACDQEHRRLWRSLALVIKAKLEAVGSKIVTFESEFLAHIVTPSGKTVGEEIAPRLAEMHETGKSIPLLSGSV